jgi:hypothetical protein
MSERLQLQIVTSRLLYKDTGPTKLNLSQLQGAFFLLVLGETVAVITFFAELIVGKKLKSLGNTSRGQHLWYFRSDIVPGSPFVKTFQTKQRGF